MTGIKSDWNDNADEFNQWEELSKDEVAEFADKQIETIRAQLEIAMETLTDVGIRLIPESDLRERINRALTKINEVGK